MAATRLNTEETRETPRLSTMLAVLMGKTGRLGVVRLVVPG